MREHHIIKYLPWGSGEGSEPRVAATICMAPVVTSGCGDDRVVGFADCDGARRRC